MFFTKRNRNLDSSLRKIQELQNNCIELASNIEDTLHLIEEKKVAIMLGFAWKSIEGVNAKRILERNGFRELMEIKKFWNDESLKENYSCPDCGNPPCVCSAIIFIKLFVDDGDFDSAQSPSS